MIDKILEFSLKQRAAILLGSFAILVAGIWSAIHLPVDAVPDITGIQVQINTEVSDLASEESEKLITYPLEVALAGLPGVSGVRSITKFGLSQLTLEFEDGTDIFRARQLVTERMQSVAAAFPAGITPHLAPISTGLGEIFYYNVQYKKDAKNKPDNELEQLMQLRELQEYFIKPILRTVPGIADINATGGYERQYVIQPSPEAMEQIGMTFSELADIVSQNVNNAGGGIVDRGGEQLTIRAISRVNSLEEIKNLPVKFGAKVKPILIRDIAEVKSDVKFRTGAATLNGREAIIGTVMMLAGQNSREVAERVKAKFDYIQKQLPEDIEIVPQYDRSKLIEKTVHTVKKNLYEGAVLVVAVLLVLLGNWRAALIVATAIPLSFLFALLGMSRFGISGNLMSLGAVDFGLIIDGAVVIVENIVRRLGEEQHKYGRQLSLIERTRVVLSASKEVASPMFFGVLIISVVYIPILALTGIEGKMFHPMALTVMLALGGALILALTLMPVLCVLFLGGTINEEDNSLIKRIKLFYLPVLHWALIRRNVVILSAIGLFVFTIWLFPRLGAEFVPRLDEGSITAMLYKPVGMSIDESLKTDVQVEEILLKKFPELTRIFSRIGTSEIATDPMPPNESDVYIYYKDLADWPKTEGRPKNKAELREKIEEVLKHINPNYSILFAQPIEMRFNEMLEGTKAEIAVKIFGNDYDVLESLAEQIKKILEETPEVAQVEYETDGRTPQLRLTTNREILQKFGLQSSEVNKAVSAALAGQVVGQIIDGNKRYDIVVRLPKESRSKDDEVRKLPLRVGESGLITLGEVVDFDTIKTVDPIRRDDGQRRAALMVNLSGQDIEGFVRRVEKRIHEKVRFPEGYFMEFGGQFENLEKARTRLMVVVPAALVLIFVLIFLALGSISEAILVFTGIPLAVTGGVLSLWIRGMPFSITAAVGFIALSGVAVLNGLVLVSYFNQLRASGKNITEVIVEGSLMRLRPVLMTAMVASLGFIPMAIATGAGAEVQRPLATVVIGGIISSTLLTLLVLPVLYKILNSGKEC